MEEAKKEYLTERQIETLKRMSESRARWELLENEGLDTPLKSWD